MSEPIQWIQRQGLLNNKYKKEEIPSKENIFTDSGTRLLNALSTFGGSAIGDVVEGVSPKTADILEKYSLGLIPHTSKEQLEANRPNNPNKWLNRTMSTTNAIGNIATGELIGAGTNKIIPIISKAFAKKVEIPISNIDLLNKTKDYYSKFGYEIPTNLEEIAKSTEATNELVKKLTDQHNTFVRGVSTNWESINNKNPEILRHLEGKEIDWKNNPQQAAEYMATHVPINTGYGRASLDKTVFNRGMEGLYTSNSLPTAEGYTYGNGYIVKVKRPTDYSSPNRLDWINKNSLNYWEDKLPEPTKAMKRRGRIQELIYDNSKNILKTESGPYKRIYDLYINPEYNSSFQKLPVDLQKEFRKEFVNKMEIDNENIPFNNRLHIKISGYNKDAAKNAREEFSKHMIDFLKSKPEYKEIYNNVTNPYAHYIHLGTPGEKILDVIESTKITPDIWKNTSRSHSNLYSPGLTAGSLFLGGLGLSKKYKTGGKINLLQKGGGLSREKDFKSDKKPYPSVKSSDFAGGNRSYPIPTKADAVDALRLAGLHNRSDVKAKVYAKYPELKKDQDGGKVTYQMGGNFGAFQSGGEVSSNYINQYKNIKKLDNYKNPNFNKEDSIAISPIIKKIDNSISDKTTPNQKKFYKGIIESLLNPTIDLGNDGLSDHFNNKIIESKEFKDFSKNIDKISSEELNNISKLKFNNSIIGNISNLIKYKPKNISYFDLNKMNNYLNTGPLKFIFENIKDNTFENIKEFQNGGNVDLYNRLNPKEGFGLMSFINNGTQYVFGGGKPRKGFNLATPEEEAYWKLYNNIPQDLVKPTNVRINADKGDIKSEYVGMPESMKERIAAMADTLNLGKIVRNPESFRTRFPNSPINYLGLKRDYEFAKKVMNNPGKGQQAMEEYSIKGSPINNTGLGALEDFGLLWDKDKKVLRAYDTYDFPSILNFVIPKREKDLKIREEIPFNPLIGSTLLKDNFKYFNTIK